MTPRDARPTAATAATAAPADPAGDSRPTVTTRGTVVIDVAACKGCLLCIDACPPGVLEMTDLALNERGYRYPVLLAGCTGCRACSQICPDFVFQVYKFDEPVQLPEPLPARAREEDA